MHAAEHIALPICFHNFRLLCVHSGKNDCWISFASFFSLSLSPPNLSHSFVRTSDSTGVANLWCYHIERKRSWAAIRKRSIISCDLFETGYIGLCLIVVGFGGTPQKPIVYAHNIFIVANSIAYGSAAVWVCTVWVDFHHTPHDRGAIKITRHMQHGMILRENLELNEELLAFPHYIGSKPSKNGKIWEIEVKSPFCTRRA